MASSLLLLLDDIASVLDDVSAMTKVAAKKTAGVLGDDLCSMPSRSLELLPIGNFQWSGKSRWGHS